MDVRERDCEMAERVHRTQIGCPGPNANSNAFVPEKEIVLEQFYHRNFVPESVVGKTNFVPKLCTRSGKSLVKFLYQEKSGTEGMGIRRKDGCQLSRTRFPNAIFGAQRVP